MNLLFFGILIITCLQESDQLRHSSHRHRSNSHTDQRDGSDHENESIFMNYADKNETIQEQENFKPKFNESQALFPVLFDVAPFSEITSNATCGILKGSEEFCKLGGSMQCSVCSGSGNDVLKKHLISYSIDQDNSNWWQSPTLEQGPQFEYVTITIDLKQEYYVWYIIIKCANSPRPENWVLERSLDGIYFSPWQYFVGNEDECWQRYGLSATTGAAGTYVVDSDNETLCSTFYSKIKPLEGGEIHAFIAKGRPGCALSCTVINTTELKEFSVARYLRVRFQKLNIPKEKQSLISDPSFQKRLFYSIKKISIGAQCICNGHASRCKRSHDKIPYCECAHNTCGNNCDICCPLFNQKPWKAATTSSAFVCEECQCHGHATVCRYDPIVDANNSSLNIKGEYNGGGVCINCTNHTNGINCEKCELGWYRPSGIKPDAEEPCLPCNCHQDGSNGLCASDDSKSAERKEAGACECLEGFAGIKCDRCAPGYYNFPRCEKCECDPRGTELSESCENQCVCKVNVSGLKCDKCKSGFFNLSANNPLGCKECICSGISNVCNEATDYYLDHIHNIDSWRVTSLDLGTFFPPFWNNEENVSVVADDDMPKDINYYWLAPNQFLGNKLTSYGLNLSIIIYWQIKRGDTSGRPVFDPDVILVGKNGLKIAYDSPSYEGQRIEQKIKLTEDEWYLLVEDLETFTHYTFQPKINQKGVTRREILSILSDIKYLLIRAKFHTVQHDCSLSDAKIEFGNREQVQNGNPISDIEQCVCPAGYTGLSCESCDYGYVRLPSESSNDHFICSLCDCNGHSPSCDVTTGQCNICEHNTTGAKCERCIEGYYGNAEIGTPTDCNKCACPLLESVNSFSPTCKLASNSQYNYVCDECEPGYKGDHCEICDDGYYGEPTKLGSKCVPCNCDGGPCNSLTGQCLSCEGNTEGFHCERCKEGHFGLAAFKNCTKCDCSIYGSEDVEICDKNTGQCNCKMNYMGRTCDKCLDGFGNINAGCVPCNCNIVGSSNLVCDPVTGNCQCKTGVMGALCDSCLPNYYGFESGSGCKDCSCNETGSLGASCDLLTGQCDCKQNVEGQICNQCREGFWGLTDKGCKPCNCDDIGSVSQYCNPITGQCTCKYGITGLQCNHCQNNFYGFSKFGCFECEPCNRVGHICNRNNGRCVCPTFTEGLYCERCIPSAWNYTAEIGCQSCDCEIQGSKSSHCDSNSGKCECRLGYTGNKCNSCAPGYYGYPKCRLCSCNHAGSDPETCSENGCLCDHKGQCYCKLNVMGKKCDICKEGTFGLHEDNLEGCTACFCFGRSTLCSEAGLTWSHIKLRPNRSLTVHYDMNNTTTNLSSSDVLPVNTQQICFVNLAVPGHSEDIKTTLGDSENNIIQLNVTNNLRIIPGENGNIEIGVNYVFNAPLYWQLPHIFLGDKILSYGGFIEFVTETEGETTLLPSSVIASYPLIQIQGNEKFILEYFPPIITSDSHHRVRFHESLWKLKNNPTGHVSRDTFMLTLQNLQHILIRATKSVDFTRASLSDVSMDIAAENSSPMPPLLSVAHGVELCECPTQYRSSSCQNPDIGYYRYYGNKTTVTSTIIIQVVGEAVPCECNGYSSICDPETGNCLNCSNSTGGSHCEKCAEGYHKSEIDGTCQYCPCPSWPNNHANTCYIPGPNYTPENVICYCKQGYTGKYCDQCAYGWYGYPKLDKGSCEPCKCNIYGSVSDECHEETGQCNCKPGIVGRDCSLCEKPNEVLVQKGCQTCNDTCVRILLDIAENLAYKLTTDVENVLKKKLKLPWNLLDNVNESFDDAKNAYDSYLDFVKRLSFYSDRIEDELKKKIKIAISKIKRIGKYNQNLSSSSKLLQNELISVLNILKIIEDDISDFITNLNRYVNREHVDYNLSVYVNEARNLLRNMKDVKHGNLKDKGETILSFCRITDDMIRNHENNGPGLRLLKKKVEKLTERVEDLNLIIANTSASIKNMYFYSSDSREKLAWIIDKIAKIGEIFWEITNYQKQTNISDNYCQKLVNETKENIHNIHFSLNKLKNLIQMVEEKEGILFNLNPIYLENYVNPALQHADELLNRAKHYASIFATTKQDADIALKASTAYRQIVNALDETRKALNASSNIMNEIFINLHSKQNKPSVIERAGMMEETSRQLKTLAAMELIDVDLLQKQFEYQQNNVASTELKLLEIIKNTSLVSYQLNDIDKTKDSLVRMNDSLQKYKNSIEIPDDTYDRIFYVQDNINDEIKPKLFQVQSFGEISIKPMDALKIKETEEDTMKMITQLNSLQNLSAKKNEYFEKWNSTLADQLFQLKNKIEQTKHLANGIHLSLSSKNSQETCTRSYQLKYLKPAITNYITIIYAISSEHRDALLFYISSSISGDFLAVEMINRKIRFAWDLGGGPAELVHPLHIQTAKDLQKEQHWYKIEIQRIGNIGKLSVRPVISSYSSSVANNLLVTNASVPGWSRFDVSSNDLIWVGGTNKSVSPFLLNKQNGLIGCLYQVTFDNKPIGLWNFKSETVGSCVACAEGVEEIQEDGSFSFMGDGYSVLKGHGSSIYNKYSLTISFNFRTFDENALLFYAAAPKPEQYISITMKDGRVLLQIGYREDLKLEIKTISRYTTGNWTHVDVIRNYDRKKKIEKGVLKVGGESKEAFLSPSPNTVDIPDLSAPQYFVGGSPPGFKSSLSLPGSFLGCMSDIQINQEFYNPLRGRYWNIQKSCLNKPLTMVGFKGNGYLELVSHPLKKSSSLSFIFSTNRPDAFLVLSTTEGLNFDSDLESNEDDTKSTSGKEVNFYSISLRDGRIEFIVNTGKGNTEIISRSDTNYSDGQFHSVNVIKNGKRLELRVDDIIQAVGFMEEDGSSVVRAAGKLGGLFFGGLPSDITFNISKASNVGLLGTIKDAMIDDKLIYFDGPIEFEQALIGRTGPQLSSMEDAAALTLNTQEGGISSCQKSYTYSVQPFAVQFGDLPNSYVRLDYDRQIFHNRNATIELSFRTYYMDGVLLIIPSEDEKQDHFLKLFLNDGKIIALVKSKKRVEMHFKIPYNDGNWHYIKLLREGKTLYLLVDESHSQKMMIPRKLNLLNSVFIGGFSSDVSTFDSLYTNVKALKGCIKEVHVNGKKEDLVGEKAKHHHIGQCFPVVERGAYFPGDAFSISANNFSIGTSLQFEMEFRTTEINGILLFLSESFGYPSILLEINQGRIILNGDMGDRRPFKIELELSSNYRLCDNEWHQVKINFIEEKISLHIDNENKMYWLSDNGHITEARTNSPLYIGGMPEHLARKTHMNKENFKGCIRNVVVRGHELDWMKFPYLHNVLVSSCPVG